MQRAFSGQTGRKTDRSDSSSAVEAGELQLLSCGVAGKTSRSSNINIK